MKWDEVLKEFSEHFLQKRASTEKFDPSRHSFYIYDPEIQFLSLALTGYLTDSYYMTGVETLMMSLPLHREVLNRDPELYMDILETARYYGTMKDQVMLGILILSRHEARKQYYDRIVELLASFPPNQIYHKFVKVKRKEKLFGGLASFDKRLLHDVIKKWVESGRLVYYIAKYRKYIKKIVELTHYPLEPDLFKYLSAPSKYDGDDEYLKAISEFYRTGDFDKLPKNYPFEILRSHVNKSDWTFDAFTKSDLTGNMFVLMAVSLYEKFGNSILPYLTHSIAHSKMVTADKILKAAVMAYAKGYDSLAKELAKLYANKVKETYKELLLPLDTPNVAVVLDASGSMEPTSLKGEFFRALSVIAPLSPIVKYLIVFSNEADFEDPTLLSTFDGLIELKNLAGIKYSGGTCIVCGLARALELADKGEIDTVIIVTDEQANVTKYDDDEMSLIRELLKRGIKVIVLNPTRYPVHIADIKEKELIYVPAPNPESLVGALKLIQLKKALKKAKAKKLVKKLIKVKATTKKKKKQN